MCSGRRRTFAQMKSAVRGLIRLPPTETACPSRTSTSRLQASGQSSGQTLAARTDAGASPMAPMTGLYERRAFAALFGGLGDEPRFEKRDDRRIRKEECMSTAITRRIFAGALSAAAGAALLDSKLARAAAT